MANMRGTKEAQRERPHAKSLVLDESGSTLVVVMVFAIIMLISVMAIMEIGAQDAVLAVRDVRTSQAFYNAEAGAERGEAWLMGQSSCPTTTTEPFSDDPETFAGGLYHIVITPDASGARAIYTVTSYATVDGRSKAIQVDLTPTAFSDYLYYTNSDVGPGGPGYFRSGDVSTTTTTLRFKPARCRTRHTTIRFSRRAFGWERPRSPGWTSPTSTRSRAWPGCRCRTRNSVSAAMTAAARCSGTSATPTSARTPGPTWNSAASTASSTSTVRA
jgi:hypothetical protein